MGTKIHFNWFVLLSLAVICFLFLPEAPWLPHLNFYHLCESLHIWTQNGSPVAQWKHLSDRVRSNVILRNLS